MSAKVANRAAASPAWSGLSLRRVVLLLALVTSASLVYLYTAVAAQDLDYQRSRALERQRELMESSRRLRVELSILQTPAQLEREGARHGLAPAGPGQVRSLR